MTAARVPVSSRTNLGVESLLNVLQCFDIRGLEEDSLGICRRTAAAGGSCDKQEEDRSARPDIHAHWTDNLVAFRVQESKEKRPSNVRATNSMKMRLILSVLTRRRWSCDGLGAGARHADSGTELRCQGAQPEPRGP